MKKKDFKKLRKRAAKFSEKKWMELWDEIYRFQRKINAKNLPETEEELSRLDLFVTYGKCGEKLLINKELSNRLFIYRNMY